MRSYIPVVARLFLGLIFVMSGISKISGFEGTQQHMASHGIPMTALFLVAAIVVEILGGLSVIVGLWARAGATVLFLFLIPATLIFHTDFNQQSQLTMFLKNIAIMGGLLVVVAFGSGPYRIRALDLPEEDPAYA